MNRQEFEDTARRYREELFRMYAAQNPSAPPPPRPAPPPPPPPPPPKPSRPAPPPPPKPSRPVPPPPPKPPRPVPPPPPKPPIPLPPFRPAEAGLPQDAVPVQGSLPEADLPPAEITTPVQEIPDESPQPDPVPDDEPALPKRAYTGMIRVHTATAQGALPVAGAAVIITRIVGGEQTLISLQTTDESGNIKPVTVPAPQPSADQRHPASFLYDITAQAAGYYREHSTDVPVFPNVTSVQNFDLIPLPAGTDEPDLGGDLTFYNNMQQY